MNDDHLLEELRAQRELIRQHLEWLDQKIADRDKGKPTAPPLAAEPLKEVTPSSVIHANSPTLGTAGKQEAAEMESEWEEELGQYKEPGGNEVQKAKLGCLLIFVAGILLFLFFLFGLPYLMN